MKPKGDSSILVDRRVRLRTAAGVAAGIAPVARSALAATEPPDTAIEGYVYPLS